MVNYDLTNITNATNVVDLYAGVNVMTDNLLLYLSLASIFIVMFMVLLRRNPPAESMLASSMTSGIVSLLFIVAGIEAAWLWFIGFVVIAGIAAVSLYINRA